MGRNEQKQRVAVGQQVEILGAYHMHPTSNLPGSGSRQPDDIAGLRGTVIRISDDGDADIETATGEVSAYIGRLIAWVGQVGR